MSDLETLRSVVSEIEDTYVSLEERDRLAESEELLHLCGAYDRIYLAARCSDRSDVWSELEEIEQLIEDRLDAIAWEDPEEDLIEEVEQEIGDRDILAEIEEEISSATEGSR
jgi:hypothetical protein